MVRLVSSQAPIYEGTGSDVIESNSVVTNSTRCIGFELPSYSGIRGLRFKRFEDALFIEMIGATKRTSKINGETNRSVR